MHILVWDGIFVLKKIMYEKCLFVFAKMRGASHGFGISVHHLNFLKINTPPNSVLKITTKILASLGPTIVNTTIHPVFKTFILKFFENVKLNIEEKKHGGLVTLFFFQQENKQKNMEKWSHMSQQRTPTFRCPNDKLVINRLIKVLEFTLMRLGTTTTFIHPYELKSALKSPFNG